MGIFSGAQVVQQETSPSGSVEQAMFVGIEAARRRLVAGQKKAAIRELREVIELLIEETDVYMGVWGSC